MRIGNISEIRKRIRPGLQISALDRGPELIVNGNFATDTDWLKGTGWSISGGMARINGTNTSSSVLSAFPALSGIVVGAIYEAQFQYASTSGRLRFNPVVGNIGALAPSGSSGTMKAIFTATGDPSGVVLQAPDASTVATVSLISLKRVLS